MSEPCKHCEGTGYLFNGCGSRTDEEAYDECEECGGTGEVEESDDEQQD